MIHHHSSPRPLPRPLAIIAIPDVSSRERVSNFLIGLRWEVSEARGGAEALMLLDAKKCEALLLDSWLPDLDVSDFLKECRDRHPDVDVVMLDHTEAGVARKSPRRQELLMALRRALDEGHATLANTDTDAMETSQEASWKEPVPSAILSESSQPVHQPLSDPGPLPKTTLDVQPSRRAEPLPELVGDSAAMLELCRMVRLVAPRRTTVLIEGPTGTGKELVARALHRLSPRAYKPMTVLNCAAIPESLLEAELFGHTRGAFTGAVNARVGRIEAAHGGTLFLDEIGEMPLMLQSKLLRFLECGELQRIGENEPVRVDVRVIAATHQPLLERAAQGSFRQDLYYRLSVFPVRTPALSERREDIPSLASHFLRKHGSDGPAKTFSAAALESLKRQAWAGNVRELEHVVERAYILAEDRPTIEPVDLALQPSA